MNATLHLFEYWYLGFIAIFIATFANLIGAGGSKFFSPLYMYLVRLNPLLSIVCALTTQTFGFGSGTLSYYRQKEIDFEIAFSYLYIAIPLTIVGAILAHFLSNDLVEIIFAFILILNSIAIANYAFILDKCSANEKLSNVIEKLVLSLGSFFLGFISVGLGELITPTFLLKYKFKPQKAVGTAVFIVFISTLAAVATHIIIMEYTNRSVFQWQVLQVLIWTIPGAIIGAQIGSKISAHVSRILLKNILTVAFLILGLSIILLKILR